MLSNIKVESIRAYEQGKLDVRNAQYSILNTLANCLPVSVEDIVTLNSFKEELYTIRDISAEMIEKLYPYINLNNFFSYNNINYIVDIDKFNQKLNSLDNDYMTNLYRKIKKENYKFILTQLLK